LREVYVASLEDSELVSHRADLALLNARKLQLLDERDVGRDDLWSELLKTIETGRKVAAAERDRLVQLGRMMSVEDLAGIIEFVGATVLEAVNEHVSDPAERDAVLAHLASEMRARGDMAELKAVGHKPRAPDVSLPEYY
jgi:hypothetical protein